MNAQPATEWTQAGAPAVLAETDRYLAAGVVDLSSVGRVDSTAVALLLELTRRARSAGKPLRFTNVPASLLTLTDFFGITELVPLEGS